MKCKRVLYALTLAVSASLSTLAAAAGTDLLATTTGSVTNLSYEVVDLNKWDFYLPSLKVAAGTPDRGSMSIVRDGVGNSVAPESSSLTLVGGPFTTTNGSLATAPGLGQAAATVNGASQFTTSASINVADTSAVLSQLAAEQLSHPTANQTFQLSASGAYRGTPPESPNGIGITLSARSSLIIHGTYSVSSSLDSTLLDGAALSSFLSAVPGGLSITAQSGMWMNFGFADSMNPGGVTVQGGNITGSAATVYTNNTSWGPNGYSSAPQTQSFTMVITNNNYKAISGYLQYNVVSGITIQTTAVPEPGTWALHALGLVCLTAAWRRQRSAAGQA